MAAKKTGLNLLLALALLLTGISGHSQKEPGPGHSAWNTLKSAKYGFECKYPGNYIVKVEENTDPSRRFGHGAGGDLFKVTLTNPDFRKTAYEALSKKEFAKYAKKPVLVIRLRIMDFREKTRFAFAADKVIATLLAKGLDPHRINMMLTLSPTYGDTTLNNAEYDSCKQELLFINGLYAVKSVFCFGDEAENTTATYYPVSDYILQIYDHASEYEKIGMVDKIMKNLKIYSPGSSQGK